MHYHIITLFPEIFESFLSTSLIAKAQEKRLISCTLVNPRDFCTDKHKQIDDDPYGGGAGMLMKAEPVIDAIKYILGDSRLRGNDESSTKVILLWPSKEVFNQKMAHVFVDDYTDIIFICGRYEGIDHRVELWCQREFGEDFCKISLGKFVTLGGEAPAMNIIEATARLVPWVIKEEASRQDESYRPEQGGENIEYPHYTRPAEVEGLSAPEVLLSGHHGEIKKWRERCIEK